jgi:hypothetical protein
LRLSFRPMSQGENTRQRNQVRGISFVHGCFSR